MRWRSEHLREYDALRPSRYSSSRVRHLAAAVAETFSPDTTELERLFDLQPGMRIVANIEPIVVWEVTAAPVPLSDTQARIEATVRGSRQPVAATLHVDLGDGDHPVPDHLFRQGHPGDWIVAGHAAADRRGPVGGGPGRPARTHDLAGHR